MRKYANAIKECTLHRWLGTSFLLLVTLICCGHAIAEPANTSLETRGTDPLIVHGLYYWVVEEDAIRATTCFRDLLAQNPKNWEANYFMAQILHDQIKAGNVLPDKTAQVEQYLQIALQNGLRFDRLHPDFRVQPTTPTRLAASSSTQLPLASAEAPPVLVTYTSDSDIRLRVLSSDVFGYTRMTDTQPGQMLRLESGQRYKLTSQSSTDWKAWTLPGILAAVVVGLVAVR